VVIKDLFSQVLWGYYYCVVRIESAEIQVQLILGALEIVIETVTFGFNPIRNRSAKMDSMKLIRAFFCKADAGFLVIVDGILRTV
jgi:hypothetical protein